MDSPSRTAQSSSVHVVIRVRPQNSKESAQGGTLCVDLAADGREVVVDGNSSSSYATGGKKTFTFDRIFGFSDTQQDVFGTIGAPIVKSVLQGYNGTILAYGQTSSGKTHTMMGPDGGNPEALCSDQCGLVPRIVEALYDELRTIPAAEVSWETRLSIFELYNEEFFDLLHKARAAAGAGGSGGSSPATGGGGGWATAESAFASLTVPTRAPDLRIREDRASGRGVYVENLIALPLTNAADALAAIQEAAKMKHVAATQANDTSSRSHTIVQLTVEQINHVQQDSKTHGHLFLIDLAGSERVGKTGATGERLKEAQNINLSLTLLGNVINKLTDGKSLHIPYRDSLLTRLLQDALGGNSLTTLLCACSPSSYNAHETLSTLMFANRAKSIQNKPKLNKELSLDELRRVHTMMEEEIRLLKERLAGYEATGEVPTSRLVPESSGNAEGMPLAQGMMRAGSKASLKSAASEDVEELKQTIRSLLNEVSQHKQDKLLLDQELQELKERIGFWEKREIEATAKANDWKAKYEREKRACDSWMRKFEERGSAPNSARSAAGAGTSATSAASAAKPGGKKPAGKVTKPAGGGARKSIAPRPPTPREDGTSGGSGRGTPQPENESSGNVVVLEKELEQAKQREADSLLRERDLTVSLDDITLELESTRQKLSVSEKALQDADMKRYQLVQQQEEAVNNYEKMLRAQDNEIAAMQVKLDQRAAEKDKVAELKAQLELREREQREKSPARSPSPSTMVDDSREVNRLKRELHHLEAENAALHDENRNNASRLLDLSKRLDKHGTEINDLKDERDRLLREIDSANISQDVKNRILGAKILEQRSQFRKKLLECFSRDDD